MTEKVTIHDEHDLEAQRRVGILGPSAAIRLARTTLQAVVDSSLKHAADTDVTDRQAAQMIERELKNYARTAGVAAGNHGTPPGG